MKKSLCLLLVVLMCFVLSPVCSESASEPDLDVISLFTEYTDLDLEPYRGKVLFLNMFTGWCTYCMQEMPDILACFQAYSPEDCSFLFIHPWDGEDSSATEAVKEKYGLEEMSFYEDETGSIASFLGMIGLNAYPSTLVIGKSGEPIYGGSGRLTLSQMQLILDFALNGEAAE